MAVYVTSDLHGFSIEKFRQLLKVINFGDEDWLYILGDVIDRNNDGGVAILRWLLEQPNVQLILGNHEQMMLKCAWAFRRVEDDTVAELSKDDLLWLNQWMVNGAGPTMSAMKELLHSSPETVNDIMAYLRDAPLYDVIDVSGKTFLLCHSGLQNFDKNKKLSDYSEYDLLWNRPNKTDRYFDNVFTVFGHTPTEHYGCKGKAYRTESWIDIDVGAYNGIAPMFLRLDDMTEFYF